MCIAERLDVGRFFSERMIDNVVQKPSMDATGHTQELRREEGIRISSTTSLIRD
jgi:hypothetical protein